METAVEVALVSPELQQATAAALGLRLLRLQAGLPQAEALRAHSERAALLRGAAAALLLWEQERSE